MLFGKALAQLMVVLPLAAAIPHHELNVRAYSKGDLCVFGQSKLWRSICLNEMSHEQ